MLEINQCPSGIGGGRDRLVVGFTTTYAISACISPIKFEPRTWSGVLVPTLCDKICQ